MTIKSNSPRDSRNPRDFNDPRNKPQERPDRAERPERSEWASRRPERPEWSNRDRSERAPRPDWAARGEQRRPPRARFENGDRPRPQRGSGLIAELRELDRDLIKMIARRSRMLTRLPNAGTSDHERELRTSWEENASAVSRDPKLIRQIFALLQEVEVAPADMEQPSAFNLAPARKALAVELPAPASDRLPRVRMVLAASGATECTLHGVPLNGPVMECLKGLNQVGARLRWEEDGRILCQGGEPVSGYNKSILDKVVHVGDDPFNLYLMLFQMVTRPARLKIIGESGLKFGDLAPIRHFLPLLGARLTSVVPGQEGLPARLESSAMLPSDVAVPAELPADALEALLVATAGWERDVTVDLSGHAEGRNIVSKVLPILQSAGIKASLTDTEDTLSLHVVPGKAQFSDELLPGINVVAAATLLAMPAFVGGSVKLSGTDISDINTVNLRDMESFVTQETHLFHDSIRNNLRIANMNATDKEIEEACKKASVHDLIMSLPQGYDTPVGELGDTLSGGERQRLGLARAFLHNAPFLLLDEPTSNLDSLNEAVILKSLREERENKTVVLVSHRQSTMRIADTVYSVEHGRMS